MGTRAPGLPQAEERAERVERRLRHAVLALAVLSVLALGGTHPVADAAIQFAWIGLLAAHAVFLPRRPASHVVPALAAGLVALGCLVLLRGTTALAWMAPAAAREAWALWPDHAPRGSLAPTVAPLYALRLAGLAAALRLGASLFAERRYRHLLGAAVVIGGLAAAAVGLAQAAADTDRVFGVYAPLEVAGLVNPLSGPFVNPNQTAALAALAVVLAFLMTIHAEGPRSRAAATGATLALGAWLLALDGRAALAGFAVAIAALTGAGVGRLTATANAVARAALAVTATGIVGLAAWAWTIAGDSPIGLMNPAQVMKARAWRGTLDAIAAHPFFGHGVGAWPDIAPAFTATAATWRPRYIESGALQLAFDHGVPVALGLAAVALWPVVRWVWRRGGGAGVPWRTGAAVVLAVVGTEFALGLGHRAAAYAALVALLWGAFTATARRQVALAAHERPSPPPAWRARLLDGSVAILTLVCLPGLGRAVRDDLAHAETVAAAIARNLGPESAERVEQLARRAPGSNAVVALGAVVAATAGDATLAERRLAWLRTWAPDYPGTWGAERHLARIAGDTPRVCLATAEFLSRGDYPVHLDWLGSDPSAWTPCIPTDERGRERVFGQLSDDGADFAAVRLATALLADDPESVAALAGGAAAALRLRLTPAARSWSQTLTQIAPEDRRGWSIAIDASRALGDTAGALAIANAATAALPDEAGLRIDRAALLVALGRADAAPAGWAELAAADLRAARPHSLRSAAHRRRLALVDAQLALLTAAPHRAASVLDALLEQLPDDTAALRLRLEAARSIDDPAAVRYWSDRLDAASEARAP